LVEERAKRKLTAILSADVKGYSRLMGEDELATVETLKQYRRIIGKLVMDCHGRVVDSPGDNILSEFSSVVDALECAVKIQEEIKEKNINLPENRRMEFRIGINLGDVIEEEDRIYGDGVNIAARLEGLAEVGGICISGTAFDQVKNKLSVGYQYLGKQTVKNIPDPVRAYKVLMEPETAGKVIGEEQPEPRKKRWTAIAAVAVLAFVAGGLLWNLYVRPDVEPASLDKMAYPLPDKPSIAVLPFDNLSGEPGQEYIADGISENIIAALSHISEMFVIARNSTFTYKGKPVKVQQVSEELGVRYVLEGSVQKAGHRLRVTAQLVDVTTGHQLWAERYDRELKDLFALQDEITVKILTALQVQLTEGEQARTWHTTDNLEAWGYVVKGGDLFGRFTKEDNAKARKLFEQASEIDPGYTLALTMRAWTHFIDAWLGYSESRPESINRAVELAKKSGSIDDTQPAVHSLWSSIHLTQGQYEKAISAGKKAIALGPNSAICHALLAYAMNLAGRFDEAIVLAEKSIRIMPYCPDWFLWILAQSYRQAGRYKEALSTYKKALDRAQKNKEIFRGSTIGLVDVCMQLGRVEEARTYVAELLKMIPNFSLEGFRKIYAYKDPAHLERILVNLRKAGLPEHAPLPLPDKPSIAVLPFVNMSDDPKQEYFSDGITEDLITDLSKISGLFVIARNSVFQYKGKPVDVKNISRKLGVRYVLEGSVRKASKKVRINAQLIDATTGGHLWAERYDRDLRDIFALQDEVTQRIVTALLVKLTKDEQERVVDKGTDSLEAYDFSLRGWDYFFRFTKEANAQAREMFERAIDIDPQYALAYSELGWTYWMEWAFGWSQDPQSLERSFELAQRAISLDDSLFKAHSLLGKIYLWKKQHDHAIAELEKTIALNPNNADGIAGLGEILCFAGRPKEAVAVLKKAIRLNPIPPVWYFHSLGHAYFLTGRYEEAITALKRVLNRNPNFWPAHIYLAASYIELGQVEEARVEAAEVLKVNPNFSLEDRKHRLPYKVPAVFERLSDSLYMAGLK